MIEGAMGKKKSEKNMYLDVILDDGEEVIESIEKAFRDNNINRARLVSAEGVLTEIKMARTIAGTIKHKEYMQECRIRSVFGEFYKKNDDYYGDVNISLAKDAAHQIRGILLKGKAVGEVKIRFKIITNITLERTKSKKNRNLVKEKILKEDKPKPKKPFIVA